MCVCVCVCGGGGGGGGDCVCVIFSHKGLLENQISIKCPLYVTAL